MVLFLMVLFLTALFLIVRYPCRLWLSGGKALESLLVAPVVLALMRWAPMNFGKHVCDRRSLAILSE